MLRWRQIDVTVRCSDSRKHADVVAISRCGVSDVEDRLCSNEGVLVLTERDAPSFRLKQLKSLSWQW